MAHPIQSRLSVSAWPGHIHLFSQAQSGEILIASTTSVDEGYLNPAEKPKSRNWELEQADTAGLPGSAVAILYVNERLRVYFQRQNRSLGELCFDAYEGGGHRWFVGGFNSTPTLPGTDIATAQHGPTWHRLHVFFQGADYAIYRLSHISGWTPPKRLTFRAMPYSAIAAVSDGSNLSLFYQDDSSFIREMSSKDLTMWTPGKLAIAAPPLTDFCAIKDTNTDQVRIYLQDKDHDIIEYHYHEGKWSQTPFRTQALPGSKVEAVIHNVDGKGLSSIYYWGPDNALYERRQAINGNDVQWLDPIPMGAAELGKEPAGSLVGEEFSDVDVLIGLHQIKSVKVRSGTHIDGIGVEYRNRANVDMRGGKGGKLQSFDLREGEHIVQVDVHAGECINQIQFTTNLGRVSPQYGQPGDGQSFVWKCEGRPLVGFNGTEDTVIRSLTPVWSA